MTAEQREDPVPPITSLIGLALLFAGFLALACI